LALPHLNFFRDYTPEPATEFGTNSGSRLKISKFFCQITTRDFIKLYFLLFLAPIQQLPSPMTE
jgi:hypothetical protein